ncbi:DUF2442 domain-containing protein [Clostridium sporogenes]|nr:DUF2442 domain-containing protein [Clostridium sporogenes]NFS26513.1 DUF2442 domain-containing protein [Clostridium sporogenes]
MHLSVKDVKALEGYKLLLTFENGEVRLLDMKPYLNKGILKGVRDTSMFKSAKVSFDTVKWENKADIDPETLYEDSVPYNS